MGTGTAIGDAIGGGYLAGEITFHRKHLRRHQVLSIERKNGSDFAENGLEFANFDSVY